MSTRSSILRDHHTTKPHHKGATRRDGQRQHEEQKADLTAVVRYLACRVKNCRPQFVNALACDAADKCKGHDAREALLLLPHRAVDLKEVRQVLPGFLNLIQAAIDLV